jgi:tetratricopeptide (TPR) repeat protein
MKRAFPVISALLIGAALTGLPARAEAPPNGTDQAGAYLAARQAAASHDFAASSVWHQRALLGDPDNPGLLEGAVVAALATGDLATASEAGQRLLAGGGTNQIAWLAVLAGKAVAGDFEGLLALQDQGQTNGELVDHLVRAWAEVGTGRFSEALEDFDKVIASPGTAAFGLYHKALALASSGDFEGADALLSSPEAAGALGLNRAVLAHAQILSQLERNPDALALIDGALARRLDPATEALRRQLSTGASVPFTAVRSATDGLAEVFYSLATALEGDSDQTYVMLYARTAAALRPDHADALMLSAGLLEGLDQFDLASAAFAQVPEDHPAHLSARIGQADAALRAGRGDEAVTLLQALAAERPDRIDLQAALGDTLRRQNRCDLAVAAYSAAIALVPAPAPGHWPLFYKRAGCYIRLDDMTRAEADFQIGLTLAPNEPRLLNELGYTWVDRGENLDQALAMIQRAVAAAPDTGYIVDSLAWAYYRLGRFEEAVAPQEKAALLMPLDPIVTDHLGDIYWQVGRKREAMFQWRRALSFGPEDKDKARILRKLEVGLDQVLEEDAKAGDGN